MDKTDSTIFVKDAEVIKSGSKIKTVLPISNNKNGGTQYNLVESQIPGLNE